ncbi:TetR/AcrR family transcriptional regulator [Oceanobacillus senegalensis]|uniref:TetR/AcrR family transcriptional regulator n=1 Tax=Oceanobacillus senegalensis TaxID=1936063 RepID=UPI000A30DEB3|nr:TetR/AcrR family transcriptional regulator [Oceanobacillus senegalensis]
MTGPFSKKQVQHNREVYILQVAEELLIEKGYFDMSMDEIASRVGISKVTLYRHFKSKEDLIFSLFFRDFPDFSKDLEQITMKDLPILKKIENMTYLSLLNFLQRDSEIPLSLISLLGDLPIFLKTKEKEIEKIEQTLADYLIPVLKEGQTKGVVDVSIPPELLLKTFFGIISSYSLKNKTIENNLGKKDLAEMGTRLYMKAITASNQ